MSILISTPTINAVGAEVTTLPPGARRFLLIAASMGFLGVALGAFGAHALKAILPLERLVTFETGIRYQMYHVFALCVVAWALTQAPDTKALHRSGWLFVVGICLFTGSLLILSTTGIRAWGAVTPLGGVAFLSGWFSLGWGIYQMRDS